MLYFPFYFFWYLKISESNSELNHSTDSNSTSTISLFTFAFLPCFLLILFVLWCHLLLAAYPKPSQIFSGPQRVPQILISYLQLVPGSPWSSFLALVATLAVITLLFSFIHLARRGDVFSTAPHSHFWFLRKTPLRIL